MTRNNTATATSQRGYYFNHGGIGLTADHLGTLDGLKGNETCDLVLRDELTGSEISRWPTAAPWTRATVAAALDQAASCIAQNLPAAAYLGDAFLGSSEL